MSRAPTVLRAEAHRCLAAAEKCFADARAAEQDAFAWWTARRSTGAAVDDMVSNVALRRAWSALGEAARFHGWAIEFLGEARAAVREARAIERAERRAA